MKIKAIYNLPPVRGLFYEWLRNTTGYNCFGIPEHLFTSARNKHSGRAYA